MFSAGITAYSQPFPVMTMTTTTTIMMLRFDQWHPEAPRGREMRHENPRGKTKIRNLVKTKFIFLFQRVLSALN